MRIAVGQNRRWQSINTLLTVVEVEVALIVELGASVAWTFSITLPFALSAWLTGDTRTLPLYRSVCHGDGDAVGKR